MSISTPFLTAAGTVVAILVVGAILSLLVRWGVDVAFARWIEPWMNRLSSRGLIVVFLVVVVGVIALIGYLR